MFGRGKGVSSCVPSPPPPPHVFSPNEVFGLPHDMVVDERKKYDGSSHVL